MEVKITTLSENTATRGSLAEWGLSLLVEADGKKILMDTGSGIAATHNADLMHIDLADTDTIILSHGHRDHTGGLLQILKRTGAREIIAHPDINKSRYVRIGDMYDDISMPFTEKELVSAGAHFKYSREPVSITEHIITTGEIALLSDFEAIDENLFIKEDGEFKPDDVQDDLALIINTAKGLVVCCGCTHRGLINTLSRARQLTGEERIYAVIGGIHLVRAGTERIERTIAELQEWDIKRLYVSHCTGFAASARLAQAFGSAFALNNAGTRIVLPA